MNKLGVLALGLAKNTLVPNSRDQIRMLNYASTLSCLTLLTVTNSQDQLPLEFKGDKLTIKGTARNSRLLNWLILAFMAVGTLSRDRKTHSVITAQDPLFLGLLAYLLARLFNRRLQIQFHGDYFSPAWAKSQHFVFFKRRLILFLANQADTLRVVSLRIKNSLVINNIDEVKIKVLPIASDLEPFVKIARGRLYDKKQVTNFIYVGRLSPEKNLGTIIESLSLTQNKDCYLRLVGDGPLLKDLQSQVSDLGLDQRVSFISWTDNVPNQLLWADVLLLASHHEAYAMVLAESVASGIPVITTDVGLVGEVISEDVGQIVKPDAISFSQAIDYYCKNIENWRADAQRAKILGEKLFEAEKDYYIRWSETFG